jgi:soluble lytic murein transglycosylase-like protein
VYSKIRMLSCSVLFLFSSANVLHADIYKYIDSKGVLHFTNMPTSSGYEIYIKEKPDINENPEKTSVFFVSSAYDDFIKQACETHGIDVFLVKAMIKVESDFNNWAISKKGAKGLMQIMPDNYKKLKIENPFNPWENIMGGTKYMKMMMERFDGKLPLALAAYNAGPTVVDRFNSIPPYSETENYVKKVMEYYNLLNNTR